ncbi:MAG: lipopolysaccharide heptosyltransferase I [Arcobacteraceae bacterium]|nr:lipopolysaccharide heptosyltransferase I [Arcobacteraceae bacterium]
MKICIVKLSAMGDIIHSQVVLQFIKQQLPQIQIDWIVEESFKGILENHPDIDNILPINLKSIKKNKLAIFEQIKLLNIYAKNNYDIVIDAQGLLKSAIVSVIVGRRIVGSKIVGFDKDSIRESVASWFYDEKVNIGYEKNVIDRNCKLISKALNITITKKDILEKKAFLFSTSTVELTYDIVFVVGASKENKIYPKENFLELSQRLDKNILAVWGNDEEYAIVNWLNEQNKQIQIAPKGSLNDLIGIITNAKLVIGADTGPTHIAWAVNIPSITIFGNTPEYRNTYITDINKVIKSDSYVNPLKLDKNDFSIKEIKAKDIYHIAKELLVG